MPRYGLIGYPLSHSFSPGFFRDKFASLNILDHTYDLFPLEDLEDVKELIEIMDGINITIPYKQKVIPYLDDISPEAQKIGAVNCIKVIEGQSIGYNTDYYGFKSSLLDFLVEDTDLKALVLGQGGASLAVKAVLEDMGISYTPISRTKPYMTYDDLTLDIIKDHRLIINTTPLGMHPHTDSSPNIPYEGIGTKHFLYDVVYNPEKTLFLTRGEKLGASIKNGHQMLLRQAEKSWEIWTNK